MKYGTNDLTRTLPVLHIFFKNGVRMYKDLSHLNATDRLWCLDIWRSQPEVSLVFLSNTNGKEDIKKCNNEKSVV
jgi:hypothetical protein